MRLPSGVVSSGRVGLWLVLLTQLVRANSVGEPAALHKAAAEAASSDIQKRSAQDNELFKQFRYDLSQASDKDLQEHNYTELEARRNSLLKSI